MTNINKALEELIKSLHKDQLVAIEVQKVPGLISTHHDGAKFIRPPVERNIIEIADCMYEQNPKTRKAHFQKEWRSIVRLALGQTLPSLSDSIGSYEIEAGKLKKRLNKKLKEYISLYGDLKAIYGCWLITPPPKEPIEIGPVRFEGRSSWLDRVFESKVVPGITHAGSSREFGGKRPKRRKPSIDQHQEEIIRRQISNAPMICEIMTHGLATELAYSRSMIAANLALTSIALIWGKPSLILERFRTTFDSDPRSTYHALFKPEECELVNVKREDEPSECKIPPKVWTAYYNDARCFLKIAGEMISCWTSTVAHQEASPLLQSLSQSLFFFWKACRESSDIVSIIEFVTSLETLAPEQSRVGIFKLIRARLGINQKDNLTTEKTLNQIIDEIYGTARSQTLHGTNPKLHYDWSNTRAIAEQISLQCLLRCMIMAQDNWYDKDTKFLLTNPVVS